MVDLGFSEDRFYRLTPRQLHILLRRKRQTEARQQQHQELCAAIVAHTVATFAGKALKDGTEMSYAQFMPTFRPQLEESRRRQSAAMFHGFLQGLVREKGLQ